MNKILKKLVPLSMVLMIAMFMCPTFAFAKPIGHSVEYKVELDGKPAMNNGHIDKTSQSWVWDTKTESASITPTCTAAATVGEYDFDKWVVSGTESLSEDWATKDDGRTVYLVNGNPETEGEIILVAKYKKHVEETPSEIETAEDNSKEVELKEPETEEVKPDAVEQKVEVNKDAVKTGDSNKLVVWLVALAAAVIIIIVLIIILTRKKK